MTGIRIQKLLAEAGVASRRAVEQMILEGRVTVNGELVMELPCFVAPTGDDIRVDGRRIRTGGGPKVYYLLNKPAGVVCTQRDSQGRPLATDVLGPVAQRVYCVGRLDISSTGLIILTNDGELTLHLTHPSGGVAKTYVVEADGCISGEAIEKFKSGVYVDGKRTALAQIKVLRRNPKQTLLRVRLSEGRNREIRRILAKLGHKVRRLKRVAIGPITDRGLKIGSCRRLRPQEIDRLMKAGRPKASPRVK